MCAGEAAAAGGLLVALPADRAQAYCDQVAAESGHPAWIVGTVEAGTQGEVALGGTACRDSRRCPAQLLSRARAVLADDGQRTAAVRPDATVVEVS